MTTRRRRRGVVLGVLGVLAATLPTLFFAAPASAASQQVPNACKSNATGSWSDIPWTISGTGSPNPAELGTDPTVTISGGNLSGDVPATILIAGYNLGLLHTGSNNIPTTVYVARSVTNATVQASTDPGPDGIASTADDVVNAAGGTTQVNVLSFIATTTITDATATGGSVTATPISISQALPDMTVVPTGGNITLRQGAPGSLPAIPAGVAAAASVTPLGSIYTISSVANGLIKANFDCQPGAADPDGPDNIVGNDDDATTFAAATSWSPFESIAVNAPPTAPVCVNESASVGVTQSITINLNDNCTDVNEDQGGGSPFTITPDTTGLAGTLAPTATPGVYSYTAPANDPGAPTTFTFTATDTTARVSNAATVSITVLANQCNATTASCKLTEIVVQPVVGTTMTLDKNPGYVVMSPVVLNGNAQVSTGAIQQLTVTNARGTAASWSLTAYVSDLGAPGGPTVDLTPVGLPGVVIPTCSLAGSPTGGALGENTASNRLCIPGDNLGWVPSADIAHDVIPGDVAQVTAGAAMATSAADWRSQLVAGTPNGLGGLLSANSLCSAPVDHSGGTFTCDATLYLGVPASAGAGTYTGGLVFTLL